MGNFSLEVKVVVDNIFPYINVQKRNESMVISGYMGELWGIIERALNFKNHYIQMNFKDGKEALVNKSVDIILIPVVVTTTDVDDFDFSIPVAKNWYEMYLKRYKGGATSVSYVETWNTSLWVAFISSIFTLSTVLWMMIKTRKKLGMEETPKQENNELMPKWRKIMQESEYPERQQEYTAFSSCFLMVLGGITSQGFNLNPKSASLRIVMLVVLFFGLVMINSYAAVLVSRLAVDRVDILFPTLESVAEKKSHSLCVRDTSYAYRLFKENESDTEIMPIWRKIVNQPPCPNVSTVEDIASALCKDHTVILESPHIIASIMESRKCFITRMPGRYSTAYTSLLMRKQFKFKKKINEILQKLLTSGIIDYLQKKWLYRRIPPNSLNMSTNKPVTMEHINGLLLVYSISIIFALVVLLVEKFMHWKNTKNMITLEFTN